MFYQILEGEMQEIDFALWQQCKNTIAVFDGKAWEAATDMRTAYLFDQSEDNIHFCKLESYVDYLFGTFHIPRKEHYEQNCGFAFYVLKERILFIDDTGFVGTLLKELQKKHRKKGYGLTRFLYDFLIFMIQDDLLYLSSIE